MSFCLQQERWTFGDLRQAEFSWMNRCFSLFGIGGVPLKKTILNSCGIQESITTQSIRDIQNLFGVPPFQGTTWMHSECLFVHMGKKTSNFRSIFNTASWNIDFNSCNFHMGKTVRRENWESFPPSLTSYTRCRTLRELAAHVTTMWGHSWGW